MARIATQSKPDREHVEVQEFLDRYTRALTASDVDTLVEIWETPAFVLSDEGAHPVGGDDEVRRFFAGAAEQYNSRGIVDTRADIEEVKWQTPRIAVVQVRFPWLDERGRERGDERSTYVLVRDGEDRLRLRVAIMRGASSPAEPL
jgi:ketosteroid isomerase-like protein